MEATVYPRPALQAALNGGALTAAPLLGDFTLLPSHGGVVANTTTFLRTTSTGGTGNQVLTATITVRATFDRTVSVRGAQVWSRGRKAVRNDLSNTSFYTGLGLTRATVRCSHDGNVWTTAFDQNFTGQLGNSSGDSAFQAGFGLLYAPVQQTCRVVELQLELKTEIQGLYTSLIELSFDVASVLFTVLSVPSLTSSVSCSGLDYVRLSWDTLSRDNSPGFGSTEDYVRLWLDGELLDPFLTTPAGRVPVVLPGGYVDIPTEDGKHTFQLEYVYSDQGQLNSSALDLGEQNTAWSQAVSVRVGNSVEAPAHVWVSANNVTRLMQVYWEAVTGADEYIVRRDGLVVARTERLCWQDGFVEASGIGGRAVPTPAHVYSVSAVNGCGEGPEAFAAGAERVKP